MEFNWPHAVAMQSLQQRLVLKQPSCFAVCSRGGRCPPSEEGTSQAGKPRLLQTPSCIRWSI
eukprot:949085-Amphidinium_carterae.1